MDSSKTHKLLCTKAVSRAFECGLFADIEGAGNGEIFLSLAPGLAIDGCGVVTLTPAGERFTAKGLAREIRATRRAVEVTR
jgi:hypothetical protein